MGQRLFDQAIWQQDGASAHTCNTVMDYLDKVFGKRMLALKSRQGEPWAPHSPDMNPLDSFLWGYLKSVVYKPVPTSIQELITSIERACNNVPKDMIIKSVLGMKKRARLLVERGGAGIERDKINVL